MWSVLLLIQATAEPPLRIDLKPLLPEPACDRNAGEDVIVICGKRDDERYRLHPVPDRRSDTSGRAQVRLSDKATLAAEGESAGLAGGVTVPRLMARLRIGF
ncbi:hypothetical protein [uncultured Sphingomonas sp.]|uniref:hypothetical protein n=1 Tax=uncultured Sphingomonas sp. TaxID=158754 RepID=UPI0025D32967|nr:hypothetical protein [uncultured Sphingomonas sp.]